MVKHILKVFISLILIFIAINLLLPFYKYPIEHFEYKIIGFFPFSWKFTAIFSRIIVGLIFSIAFLLIFDIHKLKWAKYLAVLLVFLPFVINPIFIENLQDNSKTIEEEISYKLYSTKEGNNLLLFVSPKCVHCKEAIMKIDVAKKHNQNFPNTILVSYNKEIQSFLNKKGINLPVDSIGVKQFLEQTEGAFPKFQMVKDNKIINKWSNYEFNYAVLDNLK